MTDSSTGGYLAPTADVPPAEDDALDDLIRDVIAGITALPPDLVRPRWRRDEPAPPEPTVDWCAFGISEQRSDTAPAIQHDGDGEGSDRYIRHQELSVACAFYGPSASGYAQRLADGFAIAQNREALFLRDMAFVDVSEIRAAPECTDQRWVRQYDMTVTLRRKIIWTYAVLNLASAQVATTTDSSPPVTSIIDINQ